MKKLLSIYLLLSKNLHAITETITVITAVIRDGKTTEYGSQEPRELLIWTVITGKIGAKAILTTAKVHISLLAMGLL